MTVRVGVIGTGTMGADHVRRLAHELSGVQVVAVSDLDTTRAAAVAGEVHGVRVHASALDVVADELVDAVLVASSGTTHEEYVLACLAARKPVFCEKPLATTEAACERVVDAEVSLGRRLVQVGFMRRYDPAHVNLAEAVRGGTLGTPLMVHCAHRNASVPGFFTGEMMVSDSAVHEIDVTRWLLDDEVEAVRVLRPRRNSRAPEGLPDPLLLLLETSSGVLVDVEVSASVGYGYDIRCEVVGESGAASLGTEGGPVPRDWRERFAAAYDVELQAWIDAVTAGTCTGPSAWDGYVATTVAVAALRALDSGERERVALRGRPSLYDSTG